MIVALSAGRDAPAQLRRRLALDESSVRELLGRRPEGVGELAVLATCHRTELYATADGPQSEAVHALASLLPGLRPSDHQDLRILTGTEAVEHLFRVAAGLDSLVIGEPQILGQVRRALLVAQEQGSAGPVMATVFGRAIRTGRRVRTRTPLGRVARSVGAIAVEHLSQQLHGLSGRTGVVVGAGEAASDAARSLHRAGATLTVVSRTHASAQHLASQVEAEALAVEEMPRVFARSEFAVVAVSGGVLVRPHHLPARPAGEPFLVLDLSVPPAVDATGRDDVVLRSLEEIPGPRGPELSDAVVEAEALVRREVLELGRWADTRTSGPAIRDLRARAERLVRSEVAQALAGLDLTPEQAEKVSAMTMRIVNRLMHGPSTVLRDADPETRDLIVRMFGLDDS
ncbi:MAG TPA: glutamyl-tRNA reductase [Actinomycetota bacterium]|nr:glutamyl-tRNA reductase [Actinomycetota bacterium]